MKTFLRMVLGKFGVFIWEMLQRVDRTAFDRAVELAEFYVAQLDGTKMKGPAKLESATASITEELRKASLSLATHAIHFVVEAAYAALRAKMAPAS